MAELTIKNYSVHRTKEAKSGRGGRVLLDKILISDPVHKLIRNKECNY